MKKSTGLLQGAQHGAKLGERAANAQTPQTIPGPPPVTFREQAFRDSTRECHGLHDWLMDILLIGC